MRDWRQKSKKMHIQKELLWKSTQKKNKKTKKKFQWKYRRIQNSLSHYKLFPNLIRTNMYKNRTKYKNIIKLGKKNKLSTQSDPSKE